MKIALFGYGKMGKLVHEMALKNGHAILAIDKKMSKAEKSDFLHSADLAIDFSHRDAVPDHVELCIQQKKNLVIGTTGWDGHYDLIKSSILKSDIGCLYAPNFSIGIALFKQIITHAAGLLSIDYDISGIEYHHREKVDSPSGTAKALTNEILKINPELKNFSFNSIRCGHIAGTHTLLFDSPADTITLTHQSRNRDAYAHGAVKAAEWLVNKKGFFTLDDYLGTYQS